MNLTIGSTTVEITSCTRLRDNKRGFYLDIKIPKANITAADLEALLSDNQEAITISQEGATDTVYYGFKQLYSYMVKDGTYHVEQVCTSEIEAQLSMAQNKVAEQAAELAATKQVVANQAAAIMAHEETIASQATVITAQGATIVTQSTEINNLTNTVNEQNAVITAQGETIATQSETIAAQSEQVTMLEESSVIQTATIDSLLLEIIPAVIADAVTVAVADALGSNSTTEESTEDSEVAE